MPIATFKFDLHTEDGREAYRIYSAAEKMSRFISTVERRLRNTRKYNSKAWSKGLESLWDYWWEVKKEEDLEDL